MADFIPDTQGALFAFANNFSTVASANEAALGLTPAQMTALTTLQTNWSSSLTAKQNADTAYKGAVAAETMAQTPLVADIRALVAAIQIAPGITDDLRAQLGINVPKTHHSAVPTPTTYPVLGVVVSGPMMHELAFVDSASATSKAKPAGVQSCELREIILAIGIAPPANYEDWPFLATDSRTPHVVHHKNEDKGKIAHYVARWISTTQETGPWGTPVELTIA